ncbi:HNH endonuclease signature motif containing protein [Azospirillum sp.]|uniref:HNH endonuclease signature motif containing protein n=1 Tax=Azospirillum sp. TaxID=34012 RepID=UPI003D71E110
MAAAGQARPSAMQTVRGTAAPAKCNPGGVVQKMDFGNGPGMNNNQQVNTFYKFGLNLEYKAKGEETGKRPGWRDETKEFMFQGPGAVRMELWKVLGAENSANMNKIYYQCNECGLFYPKESMDIDHGTPWSKIKDYADSRKQEIMFSNAASNLSLCCSKCNRSKSDSETWSYNGEERGGLAIDTENAQWYYNEALKQQRAEYQTWALRDRMSSVSVKFDMEGNPIYPWESK